MWLTGIKVQQKPAENVIAWGMRLPGIEVHQTHLPAFGISFVGWTFVFC